MLQRAVVVIRAELTLSLVFSFALHDMRLNAAMGGL